MAERPQNYWHFYWPLSLMGVVVLAGQLAQNYVLLGYESGVHELAVFTLALAVFNPFTAGIGFTPQMANVLVRGPKSFRAALRFLVTVCLCFTLPLVLVAWTPLGARLLPHIYNIDAGSLRLIERYLRYLTPLIVMSGVSNFLVGLLVQVHRTGMVTVLRGIYLALTAGVLAAGLWLGWDAVPTLSLSLLVPAAVHLVLSAALLALFYEHRAVGEDRALTQREIAAFYGPMVATTVLFTLSRPIILGFVTVADAGDPTLVETTVAALSLAFTFNMIFQSAINQFRNVFVTFGRRDPDGVRAFMIRCTAVVAGLMLLSVATPLAGLFLRHLQGASGPTLRMARQAVWVLVLVPLATAWRNYFHGLAMVHRRTWVMFAGALMRNLSILACAATLTAAGLYNHLWAAGMLAVGFGSEAITVMLFTRNWRRDIAPRPRCCEG